FDPRRRVRPSPRSASGRGGHRAHEPRNAGGREAGCPLRELRRNRPRVRGDRRMKRLLAFTVLLAAAAPSAATLRANAQGPPACVAGAPYNTAPAGNDTIAVTLDAEAARGILD